MRKNLLLTLLYLVLSTIAFGGNPLEGKLKAGERLMYKDPNQGLVYFRNLVAQNPNIPDDSTNGYIHVMVGTCHAMCGNLDSALFFIRKGAGLLPKGKTRYYALKNLGAVYRLQKSYEQADSVFSYLIDLLQDNQSTANLKAAIIGEKASVYMDQSENRSAIELLREGLSVCENADSPDTITLYVLREKLANVYMNIESYDMAIGELEKVLSLTDSTRDLYNFTTTSSTLARAFLETGNLQESLPLLNSSLYSATKLNNPELEGFVRTLFGTYFDLTNQPEQSLMNFRKSYSLLKSNNSNLLDYCATAFLVFLNRQKMYAEGLAILNDTVWSDKLAMLPLNDLLKFKRASLPIIENAVSHEAALTAYKELLPLVDSLKKTQFFQSLIDYQTYFKMQEQEREQQSLAQRNKMLEQENKLFNTYILMSIAALAALTFLVLYLIIRYRNKALVLKQELERTDQESKLSRQRLELETQIRSLRDQVIQQQKQDLLKQVDEIDKLKEELTKVSDVNQKSKQDVLLVQLSDSKNRIGLEQFLQQFNAAFPTYFSNLSNKYPDLSSSDLQFCALLRLGLSIKDISNILAIEPKSTYKRKYRIEEKMGVTEKGELERMLFNIQG